MKYKTVFFDWHGVLSNSDYWMHLPEYQQIHGLLEGDLYNLAVQWTKGECDSDLVVEKLSSKTNLPVEYLKRGLIESCKKFSFISQDMPPLIKQLRTNETKIYIVTDNTDAFDEWVVSSLALNELFDGIKNSHNLKSVKWLVENGKSKFFPEPIKRPAIWFDDSHYEEIAEKLNIEFCLVQKDQDIVTIIRNKLLL